MVGCCTFEGARPQSRLAVKDFNRWTAPDGAIATLFYRIQEGYLVRYPGRGDFLLPRTAGTVICYPVPGSDRAALEKTYNNVIKGLLWSSNGEVALHASCSAFDQRAVAFVGRSGAGKSTLAAHLARLGRPFLTDDGLLLERRSAVHWGIPASPSISLWSDSAESVTRSFTNSKNKLEVSASADLPYCLDPRQISCVFVLGQSTDGNIHVKPLSGAAAYFALIKASFVLDIENQDVLRRHAAAIGRFAEDVRLFELYYPRNHSNYDLLDKHIAALVGS